MKALTVRLRLLNRLIEAKETGTAPVNLFLDKSKDCREVDAENVDEAIVPFN